MRKKSFSRGKEILLKYILPSIMIVVFTIGAFYLIEQIIFRDARFNNITMPILAVLTTLFAFWAFRGQMDQSNRQRIEGFFFQLFDLYNNMVKELGWIKGTEHFAGRRFFNKAYTNLMDIYLGEDGPFDARMSSSMQKLERIHGNHFHLYYKGLYQLFQWVYDHRKELSKDQIDSYVGLIRSQLSHYEMMLVYFNVTYMGRNHFYTILQELGFLNAYNLDGHGSVEEKFRAEVEEYQSGNRTLMIKSVKNNAVFFTRDELYQALVREEIDIHYQPIINAGDGEVLLVEALVRWHHPEKGEVQPEDFIEQLEYYSLTDNLLDYLLHRVCQDIKKTRPKIAFSINISLEQLLMSDFIERLEAICKSYKIGGQQLQFELTESKELYKRQEIKNVLLALRDRGYRVGLDDFGDGYFSFYDLLDLPIDFIKLDKQFVASVTAGDKEQLIVSHIIDIAKLQGWHIIVEGIETSEQFSLWREMNVDGMQGYYIRRPVPYQELKQVTSQ